MKLDRALVHGPAGLFHDENKAEESHRAEIESTPSKPYSLLL